MKEAVADSLDTKVDLKHDSDVKEDLGNLVDSKEDGRIDMIEDTTITLIDEDTSNFVGENNGQNISSTGN